jgi:hypothetical protein
MWLEADYGGTFNCGNVYLWNGEDDVTRKPTTVVVGLTLFVSDGRLFEEIT